jgi:sec-independent protein translocase protein TatA
MAALSPVHLVVLVIVVLLLFGAKRLPEIGRSLGSGMREFKDSVTTLTDDAPLLSELPSPPVASSALSPHHDNTASTGAA